MKKLYYSFLESIEPLLDSISRRQCFFCFEELGPLICEFCLNKELSLKRKSVDYRALDSFFLRHEQVFHPKIFYLFNFYKETSYLIKKAKYTRPHFAKFFAKHLSQVFAENVNQVFNDDLSESFLREFPRAERGLNLYISYSPMFDEKEKERTFNFAYLLAKSFFEELSSIKDDFDFLFQGSDGLKKYKLSRVEFLEDFFIRSKDTQALFNLSKEDRVKEIKNSFRLNPSVNIKKNDLNLLLIIDDICTTGSTLMELMKLARLGACFLEQIGFTVYGRNLK